MPEPRRVPHFANRSQRSTATVAGLLARDQEVGTGLQYLPAVSGTSQDLAPIRQYDDCLLYTSDAADE